MSPSVLIREARRHAGLTQAELAARAGTTQSAIAKLERGGGNPTFETLGRALDAAGYAFELRAVPRARTTVDETQIIERLRWTPAERLAAATAASRNVGSLMLNARRSNRAAG